MLKGIPDILGPDALWLIAAMGHGDTLAVVDRNYPAHSHHTRVVTLAGVDSTQSIAALSGLLPIDTFVSPAVWAMVPDDDPAATIGTHAEVGRILSAAENRPVEVAALRRTDFYGTARKAFGALLTSESRPFSCFLLTKGVVFLESE